MNRFLFFTIAFFSQFINIFADVLRAEENSIAQETCLYLFSQKESLQDSLVENPANQNGDSLKAMVSQPVLTENFDYAKAVLQKYVYAIGGEELLRSVKDRTIDISGVVQGVQTEIIFYQKYPNKLCQVTIAGDVEQKIIFDGTSGIKIIGEEEQEISSNELVKLSYDAIMDLILEPENYGIKLQYLGLEKIENQNAYTILFTMPNGAEWLQYYDIESGLKIRDVKDIITPQGIFKQISQFYDYRTIDGIRYPFKIIQFLGNQVLDFTVESIQVNTGLKDELFAVE